MIILMKKILVAMFIFVAIPAFAELTIIADLGGESAVRFYEPIQPVHTNEAPSHPNAIPAQISEAHLLPVISHKWSIGIVQAKSLNLPETFPIFLIGADSASQNWLRKNYSRLKELKAMGFVINVNTVDEMNTLRQLAPDLVMMPSPADSLAERLGIYHYPLLITSEGISQ